VKLIQGLESNNPFLRFIKEGQMDWLAFFVHIIPIFSIYVLLLIIGIPTFFGCFFAWFCTFGWRACKDKYDICELPRRRGSNASAMCIVSLTCLLMIGSGAYGLIAYSHLFQKINYA
jgi:apolipoprotein N-acyltransferase